MNFDLEDDEMRIFSEDEAMMLTASVASDLSAKSPLEEQVSSDIVCSGRKTKGNFFSCLLFDSNKSKILQQVFTCPGRPDWRQGSGLQHPRWQEVGQPPFLLFFAQERRSQDELQGEAEALHLAHPQQKERSDGRRRQDGEGAGENLPNIIFVCGLSILSMKFELKF